MSLLVLVRHGQSTYNILNLFTGNIDVPLSEAGEKEAYKAGRDLILFHFDFAFTSILIRAIKTMDIILKETGQQQLEVIKNAALNERRYGELQGLNKAETTAKYGKAQVEIWRRSFDVRPPGGESLKDTFERVIPYYSSQIAPKLRENKNILVVAHGNSLRALMMQIEHISSEKIRSVNLPTGQPRIYEMNWVPEMVSVRNLE